MDNYIEKYLKDKIKNRLDEKNQKYYEKDIDEFFNILGEDLFKDIKNINENIDKNINDFFSKEAKDKEAKKSYRKLENELEKMKKSYKELEKIEKIERTYDNTDNTKENKNKNVFFDVIKEYVKLLKTELENIMKNLKDKIMSFTEKKEIINSENKKNNNISIDTDVRILRHLADNPKTPKDILHRLSKNNDIKVKILVALNINTGSDVLVNLYKENKNEANLMEALATNKNTPQKILRELSKIENKNIKEALLKNKNSLENNPFKLPKEAKSQEPLYKELFLNTNMEKQEIVNLFINKKIYLDENDNIIAPIIKDNKELGGYKIDLQNNSYNLLEGSLCEDENIVNFVEDLLEEQGIGLEEEQEIYCTHSVLETEKI